MVNQKAKHTVTSVPVYSTKPAAERVVQVQSVLFNNEEVALERALESLERAADLAIFGKQCKRVAVYFGDASPERCLSEQRIGEWKLRFAPALDFNYTYFGENTGSARGHNILAKDSKSDFILIQNPDVVVSPRTLELLIGMFVQPDVGMAEAKQLPVEHPKDYNSKTGDTLWATTACALISCDLFKELQGFDADTFFLYCDDVDFSWRVREAGRRVVFCPAAAVFHDKRLDHDGHWMAGGAEIYYSAEAAMLLAYKWSRPDLANKFLGWFKAGSEQHRKAAASFERRLKAGRVPKPRDQKHTIGYFVDGWYAPHRYNL